MEIRQLHYFMAVCEEMHFTKAAEKIGISQPTLSQQIRALEDELNTPLFDRLGKRIALTEAGAMLLQYSSQIVRDLQNAKDSIDDLRTAQRGTLRIGVLPSDLDYRITGLLTEFHRRFPGIKLQVFASVDILQLVLNNQIDIGIDIGSSLGDYTDERLVRIPLCKEDYVLVVSDGHPLRGRKEPIRLDELRTLPTIMYPEGYIGRDLVERFTRRRGFTLNTTLETTSATSVLSLVKETAGATVQPYPLIRQINDPGLHCIPIAEETPYRSLEILYRSDRYLGQAAKAFMERIIAFFSE
ncbi:LysR family transcriptional regulator [Cohnella sp. CIP 111063]|uniref:LysR family transcriptional regulator n=1 Tax=unclassified Cohnella TaxID=2636738 RepID=UPI000B8BCD66|nr:MULTISPECIES: LysR substrate-binding domain-containing protein [unclassified Cohnella]OXS54517.1 LysR family transcriptional regulator [Cohnella sp. CIP 111063]PRX64025.1 DNA-binding transcriptional LysR family regulator [Cohnella sp. SGD-V74]